MDAAVLGAIAFPTIAIDGINAAVVDAIQNWLAAHPLLYWIVAHPLLAAGAVLVFLFLFWGLLQAIARFTEYAWLWVLQAPIRFTQWSITQIIALFRARAASAAEHELESELAEDSPIPPRDRLEEILQRLDLLRHEQDALLQEMKTIVALEKNLARD